MVDLVVSAATAMIFGQRSIDVTSSELDLITAVASAHAYDVYNVSISNISVSTNEEFTVRRYIGGTGTIIHKGTLLNGGTLIVVSELARRFLNEGDKITVQGTTASGVLRASAEWKDFY